MIFQNKKVVVWGSLLALGLAWYPLPGSAQEPKLPFSAGERLRYEVRWRLFPAGHAELSLSKEGTLPGRWKVTAKANSTGYVSNLFKVEDEYRSTFHNPTFCSEGIRKVIHEGDRHREVTLQFDQRRRVALLRDRDTTSDALPREEQFSIPACVHDVLSALYYARTQPLEVGQTFEFPLIDGSQTVQVRVEVQAKEEVQTEIGPFQAIRVEPDVFSGNLFQEKGRMFVWFSDDPDRLPVQLKVQIAAGTITASLVAVERWDIGP